MKYTDLIVGKVYKLISGTYTFIVRNTSTGIGCNNVNLTKKIYWENSGSIDQSNFNFELATKQEEAHLIACEEAGTYVDLQLIETSNIENYEI